MMSEILTRPYVVTAGPEHEETHFVHVKSCQVLSDMAVTELGEFPDCAPAMEAARSKYDPVNACALCCSACYRGSEAFETGTGGL